MTSGGNLGGAGGGVRPPPTFVEKDEFSEILTYKRAKNRLFKCKWGGGGCRKFESFVGNLEGFGPPPHRKKWISATDYDQFLKLLKDYYK
jgi:hypothetical protein